MKQCWLYLKEWNKDLVTESLEAGVDAIICEDRYVDEIKNLGIITVISESKGDKKISDDVELFVITDKNVENNVANALKSKIAVVRTTDWDIIPLENLIPAGNENLFTFVRNRDDAMLAVGIMEQGVGGVVLETDNPQEIAEVVKIVKKIDRITYDLIELEIEEVKTIGIGDRVCVDTCTNMSMGEGLLVGNSSRGMFLVHAENIENPYVAPRAFRVNAGAVHSYVKVPGDKTRYLGELSTGDPVTITDYSGQTYTSYLGRSKIEKRPMLVVYASDNEDVSYSVVLQNAETIRLTSPDGKPVSVVKLKKGDKVLGTVEKGGRHFGMAVEESIIEQ